MTDNTDTKQFIELLRRLVWLCTKHDQDVVVLITGREGSGKSGLAYVVTMFIHAILGTKFNARKQFHWTVTGYKDAVTRGLPKGTPVTMDELVNGGTSYKFMGADNVDLADFLFVDRKYNLFQILIHPSRKWVSPIIKEHRAWFEFRVLRRYRQHALVGVYELRNEHGAYDEPRFLFAFNSPKPRGAGWREVLKLKDEFADRTGRGEQAEAELFDVLRRRMVGRLRDYRERLLGR